MDSYILATIQGSVTQPRSVAMSLASIRVVPMMLLVAAAAVRTSSGLLTRANCETHVNGSRSYHACIAGPEHLLRPGIVTFNVTVDPPNSTCGLTPQMSCTLVCISISLTVVIGFTLHSHCSSFGIGIGFDVHDLGLAIKTLSSTS